MAASADALVLVFHDGSCAETVISVKISCEGGNSWHKNNDFVLVSAPICSNNALNDGGSDFVSDRILLVACGSDEELILDVDEMLTVPNDLYVGICNGVLLRQLIQPILRN